MQAIGGAACVLRVNHDVQGVAGEIDHGRPIDADVRAIIVASQGTGNGCAEIGGQQHRAGVDVDGVDGIVFRRYVDHIVRADEISGGDHHTGDDQGLRVDLIVEGYFLQEAEGRRSYIGGGQHGLSFVPSGAVVVIVVGRDR